MSIEEIVETNEDKAAKLVSVANLEIELGLPSEQREGQAAEVLSRANVWRLKL